MDASHPLMLEDWSDEWTLAGRRHQSSNGEEQALRRQTEWSEMKTNRTVVGVDTAKRVFQLHWVDMETGEIVDQKLTRANFLEHYANLPPCVVAMEAYGGSQHWARQLRELGHEPRLLPAKAVRPFVVGNKNDARDAEAICTAVQQPGVKTVAVKSEEQQAVLAVHRMHQQLVKFRTAQINGLRGLLTEFGEVTPKGRTGVRRVIVPAPERLAERLPAMIVETQREQWARIGEIERRIKLWHRGNPASRRIEEIPGVRELTATAVVAAMGDPSAFRSGREFAAWLGLVPRHAGSGGRVRMLGISKRGDTYLHTLLIHGARSMLTNSKAPPAWAVRLTERRPPNVATVALANKTARTIGALLAHDRAYQPNWVSQPA